MTNDPHDFNNLSTLVQTHIETASEELATVQGGASIVFSKELKLKNSLCSYTIIEITFCKSSYKGAELCGSHMSYF